MILGQEEQPSLDDCLAHYGKKGMKWGVRNARPSGSDIRVARIRLQGEQHKLAGQRSAVRAAPKGEKKAAEKLKYHEMKISFLKNPDRVTAMHITKGEGVAAAILTAPSGPLGFASYVGGVTAVRKTVEKKQRTGAYDKKSGKAFTPEHKKIKAPRGVSATTKKVIDDHNNLSNLDFFRKHSVTKDTYAKRVKKHGDPYMKSPLAKVGKKMASNRAHNNRMAAR